MVVEPAATTEQPSARFEIGLLGEPIDPEFTIDRYYILGRQLGTYVAIRRPGDATLGLLRADGCLRRCCECSGQFSKVYEATSVATNEVFAVKVIQKPHLHTAKVCCRARCERSARERGGRKGKGAGSIGDSGLPSGCVRGTRGIERRRVVVVVAARAKSQDRDRHSEGLPTPEHCVSAGGL